MDALGKAMVAAGILLWMLFVLYYNIRDIEASDKNPRVGLVDWVIVVLVLLLIIIGALFILF